MAPKTIDFENLRESSGRAFDVLIPRSCSRLFWGQICLFQPLAVYSGSRKAPTILKY